MSAALPRPVVVGRLLSAALLLAMGGIHLYLVFSGFGGLLGVLFMLNAIGGLMLAAAMLGAPRRFLPLAGVLSLLFLSGTLAGLILALTVGLFGIREQLSTQLVPTTLVVEAIGAIVIAATTVLAWRANHNTPAAA
jgi:hypothetical protein